MTGSSHLLRLKFFRQAKYDKFLKSMIINVLVNNDNNFTEK